MELQRGSQEGGEPTDPAINDHRRYKNSIFVLFWM